MTPGQCVNGTAMPLSLTRSAERLGMGKLRQHAARACLVVAAAGCGLAGSGHKSRCKVGMGSL